MPQFPLAPPADPNQTLRDIFHEQYSDDELPILFEEIKGGTDRTVCIILSSMIERCLERLILAKLTFGMGTKFSKTRRDALFSMDGPLSSFGGNIKLAWAVNLITGSMRNELDAVRRVRNKFAHSAVPINLASAEIQDDLNKIRLAGYFQADFIGNNVNAIDPENRRYYVMSCLQIISDIAVQEIAFSDFAILVGRALAAYETDK